SRSRWSRTVFACRPSRSARSFAARAVVERANSLYIAKRVSSPRAFRTVSWSATAMQRLTVAAGGHIFKVEPVEIHVPMPLDVPDPDDPGAAVHKPLAGPAPTDDAVRRVLAGVIDPELHADIVELGMVDDIRVAD